MRVFIWAFVVMALLALIAAINSAGTALGVSFGIWLAAAILSFSLDLLTGWVIPFNFAVRQNPPPPAA